MRRRRAGDGRCPGARGRRGTEDEGGRRYRESRPVSRVLSFLPDVRTEIHNIVESS